jgi:hypothetical protein
MAAAKIQNAKPTIAIVTAVLRGTDSAGMTLCGSLPVTATQRACTIRIDPASHSADTAVMAENTACPRFGYRIATSIAKSVIKSIRDQRLPKPRLGTTPRTPGSQWSTITSG